jgi:PAS domain S-box-containing protein
MRAEAYAGTVSTSSGPPPQNTPPAFHLGDEDMRAIVESLPILIVIVDLERKIRFYNGRDETAPQVVGRDALDFMAPEDREAARRVMDVVLSTGEPATNEMRVTDLKGGLRWLEVHVGPLRHGGEVVALAFASIDVTERKRAELLKRESDEKLAALVATLKGYAEELEEKNRRFAAENAERERTELLLRQQREVVTALSTPIIQAWEGVLALPIVGALDRARATQLMEKLLAEIKRTRARFTVLDLTGVEAVDTETAGHLHRVVRAASLLGSRCLISGISPAVAQAMVSTGAAGEAPLMTFGQMQDAIRYALQRESAR